MSKNYTSLGLMSGTSGDGVDASIVISDGINDYESIKDKYYEYDKDIYSNIHFLKEKIHTKNDLKKLSKELNELERKITFFHAKVIKDLQMKNECLVGFHGQTIYHNPEEKISNQLGDANLLFQLIQKRIIFNFRKNDILNGGEGAPLTPLFHNLIVKKKNLSLPTCILNIGGIANITVITNNIDTNSIFSKDIGPGNCLIDKWVRNNSRKKFDDKGTLATIGEKNEIILEQAQELYANRINKNKRSFDISDFDISFARGLSLEDGTTTLTDFTASIIGEELMKNISNFKNSIKEIVLCGGGRKNKILVNQIQKNVSSNIKLKQIDEYNINGDFIESQAFAFLAIRSYQKLPISFPNTTGCKIPCLGGDLIDFK